MSIAYRQERPTGRSALPTYEELAAIPDIAALSVPDGTKVPRSHLDQEEVMAAWTWFKMVVSGTQGAVLMHKDGLRGTAEPYGAVIYRETVQKRIRAAHDVLKSQISTILDHSGVAYDIEDNGPKQFVSLLEKISRRHVRPGEKREGYGPLDQGVYDIKRFRVLTDLEDEAEADALLRLIMRCFNTPEVDSNGHRTFWRQANSSSQKDYIHRKGDIQYSDGREAHLGEIQLYTGWEDKHNRERANWAGYAAIKALSPEDVASIFEPHTRPGQNTWLPPQNFMSVLMEAVARNA